MKFLRYLLPNGVTLLAALCGVYAIALSFENKFVLASWFVLYAAMLDKLDGSLARWLKAEHPLGKYLDSASDVISFGVAPSVIITLLLSSFFPELSLVFWGVGAVYTLASSYRLVKFTRFQADDSTFKGMPTTLSAILCSLFVILLLKYTTTPLIFLFLPLSLLILSGVMNAPIPFRKIRKRKHKIANKIQIIILGLVYVLVFSQQFPEVLLGVSLFYIFLYKG